MSWSTKAAALALVLSLGGCSSDDSPGVTGGLTRGCAVASECNQPLVCILERCHQACGSSADCPPDQRCVSGNGRYGCQLPQESTCVYKSDCLAPLTCGVDGACRNECQAAADCVAGQACVSGTCADSSELTDAGQLPMKEGGLGGSGGASGAGGGGAGGTGGAGGSSGAGGAGGSDAGGTIFGCNLITAATKCGSGMTCVLVNGNTTTACTPDAVSSTPPPTSCAIGDDTTCPPGWRCWQRSCAQWCNSLQGSVPRQCPIGTDCSVDVSGDVTIGSMHYAVCG